MRRFWCIPFCCVLFGLTGAAGAAQDADPFPGVASSYLVQVNGKTLWEHHSGRALPPASLTKMMTALLVLERGRLDEVVIVTAAATREAGARLGLAPGDRMRAGDLLAAALLGSANDAAHALAERVGGDERRFVRQMNRRAQGLGMRDTRFANATGHDHPGHYSTGRDLAILAEAALRNETFARLVATPRMTIRTSDGGRTFSLENRNEMMGRYPGAIGVKSGQTRRAGPCLVALAERHQTRILLVLLNAPNRWRDAATILDAAFRDAKKGPGDGEQ
jgi:D-alanyl-D-alanine carboxypeptidase (penicillin-binding protein 5/6)